jgi:hypothetical protein
MNVDHAPAANVTPPTDSGDILRFKEADGKASLLIEWQDIKSRQNHTKLYEFNFDHWETKNKPE